VGAHKHKKQHFVSRSYLRAWCDPNTRPGQEPYVWRFSRDGSEVRRKSPDNIFYETDLYTIDLPDGGRDLVLEHGLSGLESAFVSIRESKLQPAHDLTPKEHAFLCAFVAASHNRTPTQRDHQGEQWSRVKEMMDRMIEWGKTATPEQRRAASALGALRDNRRPTLGYEEVKALAEKPLQNSMLAMIQAETPHLMRLDLAVFSTPGDNTFITSDNPCVWSDPDSHKRPPMLISLVGTSSLPSISDPRRCSSATLTVFSLSDVPGMSAMM